jgi:hypothetical protein
MLISWLARRPPRRARPPTFRPGRLLECVGRLGVNLRSQFSKFRTVVGSEATSAADFAPGLAPAVARESHASHAPWACLCPGVAPDADAAIAKEADAIPQASATAARRLRRDARMPTAPKYAPIWRALRWTRQLRMCCGNRRIAVHPIPREVRQKCRSGAGNSSKRPIQPSVLR